ncbi:transcriptional regulator, BadM/Rrf2 family [Thalassoporum mexicanum PCC 7367]|uniref:RrF2 family transcriptional regulator n=1 Tax=Thalassoporum mexicanum TaxID=3457544 RepID=UPI00029FEBDE|nr:Rrf2 family transcriptional regulator [Pseudanabaena sp. PCC 7367]AFY69504.1 transcriptional regulator, BadM/Rrf2 family [Pseudanabaena sp. PCC 7367]
MKLTRKGHYSVKAMLDLATSSVGKPISVREIADRQSIPAPYLEKLLIALRQAGLVRSVRGAQGGYLLKRSAQEISLGEILAAVGESVDPLPRLEPNSEQAQDWVTFALWQRLHQKISDALYGIYLEDLYYDARSWQAAQGQESEFIV